MPSGLLTSIVGCPRGRGWLLLASLTLLSMGSDAQQTPPRAGEVTAVVPLAQILRGAAAPVPAGLHAEVRWRDLIETERRARARIELLDGSILNLGSAAKLLIARHEEKSQQTEMELLLGKARVLVRKIAAPEGAFTVRTTTALVGVIGTHVYVEGQAETTTVITLDTGHTRVRSNDPALAEEQILEPFELTTVARGQPPTPKRLATVAEILQAILDTLPGLIVPLGPGHARAGSCTQAVVPARLVDADGDGRIAHLPFLQATLEPCSGGELTPVQVCVPKETAPGLYEFALPTAAGERLSAFLVRAAEPPNRLEGARLIYAPEAPPGSVLYARLLDTQNLPLEGIPVRLKKKEQETVVHTDATGGFAVRIPESGNVEMTVERGSSSVAGLSGELPREPALPPLSGRVEARELPAEDLRLPELVQRESAVNVPGEVVEARLGDRNLPIAQTVTGAGRKISSVAVPSEVPAGPSELVLKDSAGQIQQRPLVVFNVLAARLDQPALTHGLETRGEFIACVGEARLKSVRAHIVALGPVHFRGKGAKGKVYERKLAVGPGGLVEIPFRIRAEKGAPGKSVPFTVRLLLSR